MVLNNICSWSRSYNSFYSVAFAKNTRLDNDLVYMLTMRCFHHINNLQSHLLVTDRTMIANLTTALCIERRTI
ncbi:hypothetical protein D3C85_932840 [compost metagenome]